MGNIVKYNRKNDMRYYIYKHALFKWQPIKLKQQLKEWWYTLRIASTIDPVMTMSIQEKIINLKKTYHEERKSKEKI